MLKMGFYSILTMEWSIVPNWKMTHSCYTLCLEKIPLFFPPTNNGSHKISIQYLAEIQELVVDVSAVVSMDLGVLPELCNGYSKMSLPPPLALFRRIVS